MQMTKHLLFSVLTAMVLIGPLTVIGTTEVINIDLPIWLTAESSSFLSGGVAKTELEKQLNPDGMLSGDLQEALGAELDNHIPLKLHALLGNAAIQRNTISAANTIFAFDCYPTLFGGTKYYAPATNSIAALPTEETDNAARKYREFATGLSSIAKDYPDIPFVCYLAEGTSTTPSNPVSQHVSFNTLTVSEAAAKLQRFTDAENVTYLFDEHEVDQEFYRDYFRTDHHWNALGAHRAYNTIAKKLDWPTLPDCNPKSVDGPLFHGSESRTSLCILDDQPFDIDCSFGSLDMTFGQDVINGDEHPSYYELPEYEQQWTFYDSYYRRPQHVDGPGKLKALMIGDSYSHALVRFVGMQLASLDTSKEMHSQASYSEAKLRDRLDNEKPDVVFFVARCSGYVSILKNNPNFFD